MNAPVPIKQLRASASNNPAILVPVSGVILPHELPNALDQCPNATILSLDCFDTLLWRDCHAPTDLFATLRGVSPLQRRWAESQARRAASFDAGRGDVTIAEIYAALYPKASTIERDAAIAAECTAEARHAYGFAPTVSLMRVARARGVSVVIVSDTYLDEDQLRSLIAATAGADIAELIDRIFVSSRFGKSKAQGLYTEVLRELAVPANNILHIGDNEVADVGGVAPFGVNTLHLRQFSSDINRQLRQEAVLDAMLHPPMPVASKVGRSDLYPTALQPHRAALALASPMAEDAATRLGLTSLGPIFTAFERWLNDEAKRLRSKRGGRVHWLFLMRDGFLPMQIHAQSGAMEHGYAADISRFTAIAASFDDPLGPIRYALSELGSEPTSLARQLMIPEADIAKLVSLRDPRAATIELHAMLRTPASQHAIVAQSQAMATRLVAHVRGLVDPAPEDTLMLVDLGYNGTVQNHIDALLVRELGVHVAGRYLILREKEATGLDKAGLFDHHYYDSPALEALCAQIAVIEQLATNALGSVIDYAGDGTPIRRANDIHAVQVGIRKRAQAGALAFASAAAQAMVRATEPTDLTLWRRGAAATLARMLYLPTKSECDVLSGFEHDVNLGTMRKMALFDPEAATRGLRQRGLFHLHGADRMYLPAELQGQGLPTKLTLLASHRFALPLTFEDFADRSLALPIIFADTMSKNVTRQIISATATHDGYYLAAVPIGAARYGAALQFGGLAQWLEIDSMASISVEDFLSEKSYAGKQQPVDGFGVGMTQVSKLLWRVDDPAGYLMVPPLSNSVMAPGTSLMLAVVFRPVVARGDMSNLSA